MRRVSITIVAALAVMAFASVASACTDGFRAREIRQHRRIVQGVRSGELTRGEALRLRGGEVRLHHMLRRDLADRRLTWRERAHLDRAFDRQSRRIYRFKHNARERVA